MNLMRNMFTVLGIIVIFALCSGCNKNVVESDIRSNTSETGTLPIEDNFEAPAKNIISQINYGNKASLSVFKTDNIIDVLYIKDETECNVISHTMFSDNYIVQKHSERNQDFLIIAEPIIGAAYPATIVTLIDDKPIVLSELDNFDDNEKYIGLFYCVDGDLICERGDSVSVGATNIIPYYWNNSTNKFCSYELSQINIDELYELDKDEIVSDKNDIESIYKRSNGLVHVNYKKAGMEYSQTYVFENEKLRPYNFDTDFRYGFFLENFCITPDK